MSDDPLDYPRLVRRALIGMVREALRVVSNEGLPGEHHFFLAFRTDAPGVSVPARLRAQYPQEMTIVLRHIFTDLAVDEERFSVTLRFGGAPEHIEVPFDALTAFADPSASFALRFDAAATPADALVDGEESPEAPAPRAAGPRSTAARPARVPARPQPAAAQPQPPRPRPQPAPAVTKRAPAKPTAAAGARPTPVPAPAARKVVDLAAFRKAADKAGSE